MKITVNEVDYDIQQTRMTTAIRDGITKAARLRIKAKYMAESDKLVRGIINSLGATLCAKAGLGTLADGMNYVATVERMLTPIRKNGMCDTTTFYSFGGRRDVYFNIEGTGFDLEKDQEWSGDFPDVPSTYHNRYNRIVISESDNAAALTQARKLAELLIKRNREIAAVEQGLAPILAMSSVKKVIETFPEVLTLYPKIAEPKPKVAMPAPINMESTKDLLGL